MSGDKAVIGVGVLTVSDTCSKDSSKDKSGPFLVNAINMENKLGKAKVIEEKIVPDDIFEIQKVLVDWSDVKKLDLILTTGGTGMSTRDVTPEATKAVISKETTGLTIALLQGSLKITPLAMLSRQMSGIRGSSLIVNFPGSVKACTECLDIIAPSLPHAIRLLKDDKIAVSSVHQHLATGHQCSHNYSVADVTDKSEGVDKVARRPRKSIYPALKMEEAIALILEHVWIQPTEVIDAKDAFGCILSQDVYAKEPLPPFRASIKDGYAVIASNGPGIRSVLGDSTAGSQGETVVSTGTCVRITTGAPVPLGADAIVQVEDTVLVKEDKNGEVELEIEILSTPKAGQDIRECGSDIKKGDQVLSKGMYLGASELGVLATVGVSKISVTKLPLIAVLSTGNELQESTETDLKPGCIRDSNRPTLLALFKNEGFPVIDCGVARDNIQSMVSSYRNAFEKADVVLSTGSVSMGERDLVKHVLKAEFQATIHFGRVFMKPGLPTTFATLKFNDRQKIVFALPGNPVSATVTSYAFVLPGLRKMLGRHQETFFGTRIYTAVNDDIVLDSRPEFQRAIVTWTDGVARATSTGNQISSRLVSLAGANALLALPPSTEAKQIIKRGEIVPAILIGKV